MARRVKAEGVVGSWDVNEINCTFESNDSTVAIIVSVSDDYPEHRPFSFSESHDLESVIESVNDFASRSDTNLTQILHKCWSACCQRFRCSPPPPLSVSDAPAPPPAKVAATDISESESEDMLGDDEHENFDEDVFFEAITRESAPQVAEPVAEDGEGVKKLMEKMRQTRDFVQSGGTVQATDRLMKEYRAIMKKDTRKDGYECSIVDDNLYEWDVKLYAFDSKEPLAKDLEEYNRKYGLDHLQVHIKFPAEYPFKPPFVRVVKPGILGGYVLDGGALCMELLTPMGWSSAYSLEGLIPQLMATLIEGKARIIMQPHTNYDERAARATFDYIVETHKRDGWYTPPKGKG